MRDFIFSHLFQYGTTADITRWKPLQVSVEMSFDLSLGFHHKTQTCPITGQGRERADGEGACIPQWIQQTRPRFQLFQPGLAPGQMIRFLAGGLEQQIPGGGAAGGKSLPVVQRLGGHLAGMVDAHQGRSGTAVGVGKVLGMPLGLSGGGGECRQRPGGPGRGKKRPQGPVGGSKEGIKRVAGAFHALHYKGRKRARTAAFALPGAVEYTSRPFFTP